MVQKRKRVQRSKSTDAPLDISQAQETYAIATGRKKHAKPKKGFKTKSDAFLNQVPILGGKGVIYTTPQSGGNYTSEHGLLKKRSM